MTEAILFDNDGILVDSETLFFQTTRMAFAGLGLALTRDIWGNLYLGEGKSSRDIALLLGADSNKVDEVIQQRNRQYRHVLKQPPPLRPHVLETLTHLYGRVKMAIVTGCGRDQFDLVHVEKKILHFFNLIITSDDCSCAKPDPEPYLKAIAGLQVQAEQCLAVEDSPRGLASAKSAGVPCIVVPTELTCTLNFPGALAVEQSVADIMKHLQLE